MTLIKKSFKIKIKLLNSNLCVNQSLRLYVNELNAF